MPHLLRWLFRPTVLIAVSALLVAAAALVVFRPVSGAVRPQRLPLRPEDREVAFVYPATSGTSWDRFVAAVRRAAGHLQDEHPGLGVQESAGGPGGTAEVVLQWPAPSRRRLVFRWYKLTSDWTPEGWMRELLRPPYPLAVVGGNNSTWARALAVALRDGGAGLADADKPLLLLTTATADRVAEPGGSADPEPLTGLVERDDGEDRYLPGIYEGRTFRFSFTNRQMASAVTRFVWSRPDLRPDSDPVYLAQWMDDSYSRDLFDGYARVLPRRVREDLDRRSEALAGALGLGPSPLALVAASAAPRVWVPGLRHEGDRLLSFRIPSGVGSFSSPNPYEADSARGLLDDLRKNGGDASFAHLLVVTGQVQQSRRFLRELARSWPDAARRLVVASGDAISFNTVYRDRTVTWPVQDLPFDLVFFCHRNPIHPTAGFRPAGAGKPSAQSGTEDLLLFEDVVEAVALVHGEGADDGAGMADGLARLHLSDGRPTLVPCGRPLFSPRNKGMRNAGTGEHVVHLRPHFDGERVLPAATLEVWHRADGGAGKGASFSRVVGPEGPSLRVSYVERKTQGERPHDAP